MFDYMIENAPHVNFTADTYWLQYGGADVLSFLEKLRGRVGCVHLKDYGMEKYEENGGVQLRPVFVPLGKGSMDFPSIVAKMRTLGVQYYFVEQDNAATLPDTLAQVTTSVEYAKKAL